MKHKALVRRLQISCLGLDHVDPLRLLVDDVIAALAQHDSVQAKPEPEQEPVAWIHNFIEGGISIGKRPADLNRHPDRWTALYKDPKPCPTCEALARTVMLDQTSHDTTPPQRTWVGLTEPERLACYDLNPARFASAIEAKLKEKNT